MKTFAILISSMTLLAALPGLSELDRMIARFAPTEIRVDTSKLSAEDSKALTELIEASRLIDHIFLQQLWTGNLAQEPDFIRTSRHSAKPDSLLLAEQRPLVRSRRARGFPPRCSSERNPRRQFLSART